MLDQVRLSLPNNDSRYRYNLVADSNN